MRDFKVSLNLLSSIYFSYALQEFHITWSALKTTTWSSLKRKTLNRSYWVINEMGDIPKFICINCECCIFIVEIQVEEIRLLPPIIHCSSAFCFFTCDNLANIFHNKFIFWYEFSCFQTPTTTIWSSKYAYLWKEHLVKIRASVKHLYFDFIYNHNGQRDSINHFILDIPLFDTRFWNFAHPPVKCFGNCNL